MLLVSEVVNVEISLLVVRFEKWSCVIFFQQSRSGVFRVQGGIDPQNRGRHRTTIEDALRAASGQSVTRGKKRLSVG